MNAREERRTPCHHRIQRDQLFLLSCALLSCSSFGVPASARDLVHIRAGSGLPEIAAVGLGMGLNDVWNVEARAGQQRTNAIRALDSLDIHYISHVSSLSCKALIRWAPSYWQFVSLSL